MLVAMPRLPRYYLPNVPLHVIQRGNNRQAIFVQAADRRFYLDCLQYAVRRHGLAIHAYVLKTNHVHMLLTPHQATSLPRAMQAIGRVYVKYFNRRYGRTGTLWEGRYRATLVDHEAYLFTCMRYIELNPVRAALVPGPGDYPWSSFAANAYGVADVRVEPHPLYRRLGNSAAERRDAYRALFRRVLVPADLEAIRNATNKAWALGDDRFCAAIEARTKRRSAPLPIGRPPRRAACTLHTRTRDADPQN